ncbi:MAG: hypothetical protein ABIL06_02785 [Pseudomonadota bacterium]
MRPVKWHSLNDAQRDDVVERITAVISTRQEILFVFLHGSFLDGVCFRDIDLGVFAEGINLADVWDYEVGLAHKIEEALNGLFLVEPKVINKAPLSFCYHVIRGQLLFARDESSVVAFMVRVARSYLDIAPIRHKYITEAMI